MEVYHGAHTTLSSMAEGNGDGAFMFVLLPNMLLQVFSFVQTCLQPRPTASHKEHHACKTSVESLFHQVSLPQEYFKLNCSVLQLSPQVKWLIC